MSPLTDPGHDNTLNENVNNTRTAYTCPDTGCTFTSYSAAEADEHLDDEPTHTIRMEWTRT